VTPAAHGILAHELPPGADGRRGLVLSASTEIEPGARAMLLLAEGLFRLDAAVSGDTLARCDSRSAGRSGSRRRRSCATVSSR
jgi:hypothetical protein